LLSIASYTALFSILGTTYGGDGRTTFGLPDLRGRVAIHPGDGPGLTNYRLGNAGGAESVTLSTANLPSHTHSTRRAYSAGPGTTASPSGAVVAEAEEDIYGAVDADDAGLDTGATGSGVAFNIRQPYRTVNFIIALQGVYPSRS
jgi:microcystin-dependent protein